MIIDESFISNAKKIAETQPQHSEVKAPKIKRENWEHHVYIYSARIKRAGIIHELTGKMKSAVNRCSIFKETDNYELTNDKSSNGLDEICYEFDADLFITAETLYELFLYIKSIICKYYAGMDSIWTVIDDFCYNFDSAVAENKFEPLILKDSIYNITDLYQMYKNPDFTGKFISSICDLEKNPDRFIRWMNRNGILIESVKPDGLFSPYKSLEDKFTAHTDEFDRIYQEIKEQTCRYMHSELDINRPYSDYIKSYSIEIKDQMFMDTATINSRYGGGLIISKAIDEALSKIKSCDMLISYRYSSDGEINEMYINIQGLFKHDLKYYTAMLRIPKGIDIYEKINSCMKTHIVGKYNVDYEENIISL